ncbi:MAG: MFS transporter, partial [Sciscionella sp.]|nr:MFS transporter [Sciscionella sp.]
MPESLVSKRLHRTERLLVPAAFITTVGNAFQLTAAAIMVFHAEQNTLAVGWLFIAVAIPQALLSLFFGRLADRVDRRMLCVAADSASAITALALPVWLWLGGPTNTASYVANFLLACISALFIPASNALIKERIQDQRIGQFTANYEMASRAGMLLASAAAGFLVQYFGPMPLFIANSGTFVASAVCTVLIGRNERKPLSGNDSAEPDSNGPDVDDGDRRADAPLVRLGLLYSVGDVNMQVSNTILTVLILQTFAKG